MKKVLLIAGILFIIVCVLCLLFAALNLHGYKNIFDGSPGLYRRLRRMYTVHFIGGGVSAVISAVCFIIRSKI